MPVPYNSGPGNLRRWRKELKIEEDPLLFIESIPSRETRNFVESVLGYLWVYRARMEQDAPSLDGVVGGSWPIYKHQEPKSAPIAQLDPALN